MQGASVTLDARRVGRMQSLADELTGRGGGREEGWRRDRQQQRMTAPFAGPPLPLQPGRPIGNIYYGACSWTDRTLIDAGTFYPANARTAADRLAHYASQFPIVEVDATYYALPSERNAQLWVSAPRPASCSTSKPSAC